MHIIFVRIQARLSSSFCSTLAFALYACTSTHSLVRRVRQDLIATSLPRRLIFLQQLLSLVSTTLFKLVFFIFLIIAQSMCIITFLICVTLGSGPSSVLQPASALGLRRADGYEEFYAEDELKRKLNYLNAWLDEED